MRSRILVLSSLALLIGMAVFAGCKESRMQCYWTERPPQIDGRFGDWEGIPLTQFDDERATAALCNDSSFFYILFSVSDPTVARAIRFSGLTIWIDPEGGRELPFMVNYKAGPDRARVRRSTGISDDGEKPDFPGFREMMPHDSAMPEELRCYVKNRIVEMIIPSDGSRGPAAAFSGDSGSYIYEFRIPLQESIVRYYGINGSPGQTIGITARWGGMDHMDMMGGGPQGGGGIGGIGGSPSGGMGETGSMGGPPPGGFTRPDMPKEQEIWFSTTLATVSGEAVAKR